MRFDDLRAFIKKVDEIGELKTVSGADTQTDIGPITEITAWSAEHPMVVPVVVQRMDEPSTGAGEEVMGATTAAVANAFFDATGVRLQQFPMTPTRVLDALRRRSAGAL